MQKKCWLAISSAAHELEANVGKALPVFQTEISPQSRPLPQRPEFVVWIINPKATPEDAKL